MQVRKVDGRFEFDFTFEGRRVRRAVDCGDLVYFLEGGAFDFDANLGDGKEPISFYDFVYNYYLPLHSEARKKPGVYKTDRITMKSLARYFGDEPVHHIFASDWEEYKKVRLTNGEVPTRCKRLADEQLDPRARRLAPGQKASPWTVNRELSGLNQVMEYALGLRLLKENPIQKCTRLPARARKEFWLRKNDIDLFIRSVPLTKESPIFRHLGEFLILTGARIGEALLFNARQVDWQRREVELVTFKKRGKERDTVYRYLSIDSLGPRFTSLLRSMVPHPLTGNYFAGRRGQPLTYSWVYKHLAKGGDEAGFTWLRPHDLRHTFAMHRAMVIRDFRQLQMELGQEDPASVQSYLDNTSRMHREDSIFSTDTLPALHTEFPLNSRQ